LRRQQNLPSIRAKLLGVTEGPFAARLVVRIFRDLRRTAARDMRRAEERRMKTLRLQRDPDGFFLWHPDYAPWIVGRRSLEANPNDRAFFDPNTGEIEWSSRDGMQDYEMEELAARHLAGELVEMPQSERERDVENWFLERGFKVEWI
jgi:hypothetical protein